MRNKLTRTAALVLSVILTASAAFGCCVTSSARTLSEMFSSEREPIRFSYEQSADYSEILTGYESAGETAAAISGRIVGGAFTDAAGKALPLSSAAGRNGVFVWNEDTESVCVRVNVPVRGLYTFGFTYFAQTEASADIIRSMTLDGKIPFAQANTLRLERMWKPEGKPQKNAAGDEVSPRMLQPEVWQERILYDSEGEFWQPLQLLLDAGEHVFRFDYVSMPVCLASFFLDTYTAPKPYREVKAEWDKAGYTDAGETVCVEAEDTILNSSRSTYRMASDGDPLCSPVSRGYTVMNIVGGSNGKECGASITFSFRTEKAGLYKPVFRVSQNYRDGLPSYKRIEIDGRVPFEEFGCYSFYNQNHWRSEVPGGDDPYLVYLDAGEHTLTLTGMLGAYKPVTDLFYTDSQRLSDLLLEIRKIIGTDPDYNYDYRLDRQIPTLIPTLDELKENMARLMEMIEELAQRDTAKYNELKNMIAQINTIEKDVFRLPRRMKDLETVVTQYSSWITQFSESPLALDSVVFCPPGEKVNNRHSNFFQNFYSTMVNFILSFSKDYDNISAREQMENGKIIDVWISRGTAWGEAVKGLIDSSFTPSTGINVDMNIVTAGQLNAGSVNTLMLSIASGSAPDVCLGVSTESVGEFAMRNVLVELNGLEGFEELKQTTYPECYVPNTYHGSVFGIPETMNFAALFYRKDILSDFSLPVPETWDEVYQNVIPVLLQNNMEFFLPLSTGWGLYPTFLYQYGGSVYNEDLTACDFGSEAAFDAFTEVCKLVTTYGLPTSANFFNRFRSGEMPIGYGDMTTYMSFVTAAPEIAGRWGIARLPGHRRADGTVDYTRSGGSETSVILLDNGKDKTDEAWSFVRWWTSADIQTEFGYAIEAEMGTASRWNSANIEAFSGMAWDRDELAIMKQSFSDMRGLPIVLGGYYTSRYLNTAYNKTAISGADARSSLEEAAKAIDNELERRRQKQKS